MTPGRRWTEAVGPWLGIGAAPAALALGAAMAQRHGGAVPLIGLLGGAALMAVLLTAQGILGLRPPAGHGGTLTAVAPAYLPPFGTAVLGALLAGAMVGWNGFNVGLGAGSLADLLHTSDAVAAVLLQVAVLAVSYADPRLGNRIAVVTTLSALALVLVCVSRLAPPTAPVRPGVDAAAPIFADVAALVGYAAVFAVRAPDFSYGLARRADLARCVGLLVVPAVLVATAGAGVWLRTGSTDVVAVLAATGALATPGNAFVVMGVFVPALTTTYSGALALRSLLPRLSPTAGMLLIAVPGAVLAATRFDRHLLSWLQFLAALLPPLIVPMAVEALRRRRGRPARPVPTATWLLPGLLAAALTALGRTEAPLIGLATAAAATLLTHRLPRASAG